MTNIVSYATPNGPRFGVVVEDTIYAVNTEKLFDPEALQPGPAVMPLTAAQLLPPVRPGKIVCIGRNYAAHAAEHQAAVPDEPMLFFKPPSAIIGPGAAIELFEGIGRVDHEAELAVIIGQRARRVNAADALGYVFGYTCANDVSARDFQRKDGQWGRAKGFDTFCPIGPWITTGLDPSDLAISATVNGDVKQEGRTSDMVFNVPALIEFISGIMTLEPGDIIMTGTPAGVSPLAPGDTVSIHVQGIGALENSVRLRD